LNALLDDGQANTVVPTGICSIHFDTADFHAAIYCVSNLPNASNFFIRDDNGNELFSWPIDPGFFSTSWTGITEAQRKMLFKGMLMAVISNDVEITGRINPPICPEINGMHFD